MSREIKFRAWDPAYKMMYELTVFNCNWRSGKIIVKKGDTLLQYTGLKDKNGVEIYEGDIVRVTDNEAINLEDVIAICKVIWGGYDYPAFEFQPTISDETNGFSYWQNHDVDIKVIGNIYESPELLEGDK